MCYYAIQWVANGKTFRVGCYGSRAAAALAASLWERDSGLKTIVVAV